MPFDENQWENHVFQIFDNAFDAKKAHLEMSPYRKLWDSIVFEIVNNKKGSLDLL